MARPKDDQGLIVCQKSIALARNANAPSVKLFKSEGFGSLEQTRRAAVPIPSNIAEGHGRQTDLQFEHFLGNARGSIYELRTRFELADGFGSLQQQCMEQMTDQSAEVTRLVNCLIAAMSSANAASSASSVKKDPRQ